MINMYLLLITLGLSLVGITIFWYRVRNHFFEKLRKEIYYTPDDLPIIGIGVKLAMAKDPLEYMTKRCALANGTVVTMIGFDPYFMSTEYGIVEVIMSSNHLIHKSKAYNALRGWLGLGLLLSWGPKWRGRRKTLTPTFHYQILEKFVETFESASSIMVDRLDQLVEKGNIDIYPYVTACTLDVICETAMGTKVNAQTSNADTKYIDAVKNMGRISMERGFSPIGQIQWLYPFTPNYWSEQRSLHILHSYTNAVIKRRRQEIQARNDNPSAWTKEQDEQFSKPKVAFLDLLLECTIDGKPLTSVDISEEVETFMFEGHDTTASAISFCLYELSRHPEIQKRLVDEQLAIFGEEVQIRKVSFNDLNAMKYLDMVIKETLRLYPPVPIIGRQVMEDFQYKNMTLKKGLQLVVPIYAIQRNPKYFPDPEVFDPERFNNDNNLGKFPYSYIPFSAGPRNCIGQKFAMLEMKSTISKIIRNFEIHPAYPTHQLNVVAETILKSSNGIPMQFKKRLWK